MIEAAKYYAELRGGNFEVAADFHCGYIVEPDLDLYKFQSKDMSPANYSRYTDHTLDELYEKQGRAIDLEERKKLHPRVRAAAPRRRGPLHLHASSGTASFRTARRVKGWTITPSHYLNKQLDTVWLTE